MLRAMLEAARARCVHGVSLEQGSSAAQHSQPCHISCSEQDLEGQWVLFHLVELLTTCATDGKGKVCWDAVSHSACNLIL